LFSLVGIHQEKLSTQQDKNINKEYKGAFILTISACRQLQT